MTTLLNKSGRFAIAKRLAVCAAVAFLSVGAMAQTKVWEKLTKMKGVEYTHVDKSMIELEAKNGKPVKIGNYTIGDDSTGDILEQVDDVEVFTCEESKSIAKFVQKVKEILKKGKYQSLVNLNNEDFIVTVSQSKKGEKIQNIIFVEEKDEEDPEVVLVLINGALDITKFMGMETD